MRLIAVGRLRPGAERALFDRYAARLRPRLLVSEVAEAGTGAAETTRREGLALLAALPERAFVVALDRGGEAPDSFAFARLLAHWRGLAREPCFLIGGAEGLHPMVIERADYRLGLGPMTWPHRLVRVMLAEQLYRAQAIAAGHPYHRD